MTETLSKDMRREKKLEEIDKLEKYIQEDELDEDTQGIDSLKSARTKLILEENDLQHDEFNELTDKANEAEISHAIVDATPAYDEDTSRSDKSATELIEAREAAAAQKQTANEFASKHLDVLQDEAMKQAVAAGKKINLES